VATTAAAMAIIAAVATTIEMTIGGEDFHSLSND
jgi:hypothetical protein